MLLTALVVGAVTGISSGAFNVWTKRRMEKKTDAQTAELKTQIATLANRPPR